MDKTIGGLLYSVVEKILNYLPSLFAGMMLLGIGWFLAWFAKRIIIQICATLRLERYLCRLRWGKDLFKADVRYGLFNFIGNIIFLIVILIFLDASLNTMKLNMFSGFLERSIFFIPKVFFTALIFGIGWFISNRIAKAIQNALLKEEVPRATLVAKLSKAVLLLFFSAMALTELDIAPQIVLIGFTVAIITLGILAIALASFGGRAYLEKMLDSVKEKPDESLPEKAASKVNSGKKRPV